MLIRVRDILCKSALGPCGFPGGGLSINPYVGCACSCVYCYARFMKRFTGHKGEWGTFVDARVNIAEVLKKEIKSKKFNDQHIFIGTVTDPYQPISSHYHLTRDVLEVLKDYPNPVSILTKTEMVLRDIDLLKKFKHIDVEFTINSTDEEWKMHTEPFSSSLERRYNAICKLVNAGITAYVLMGPYWPYFTKPDDLFKKFKKFGVKKVYAESFNTTGGNWTGVEKVLKEFYPALLPKMKEILFDKEKFNQFYFQARKDIEQASKKYKIPLTVYFGFGHAAKFKSN